MTSIAQWHMDQAVFGNPTWSLGDQPEPTFSKSQASQIGSGQYEILHWARPHMINATWQMDGTEFYTFVAAWNDVTQLCFGSNFFTVDMPLQIDGGGAADLTGQMDVSKLAGLTIGTSGTTHGYDAALGIGSMPFTQILGRTVKAVTIDTATDTGTLSLFEGPFPAPQDAQVVFRPRIPGEDGVELLMAHQGSGVYTAGGVSGTSTWGTVWAAADGVQTMVELAATVDVWQRYVAHWNGPYQATKIGWDYWEITGQLEVNVHEVDIWKASA